jgi:hypothetical protein
MVPTTVWRLVRVATAFIAVVVILVQAKTLADAGKLDIVNFFSYFTIQSNVIGIAILLLLAARGAAPKPAWLESLRGAATVYLTITFVVVVALLSNVDVGLQLAWVDFALHKLTPVVIVADWVLDPPFLSISWRHSLTWLAYPLVWLAYTMLRGPIAGWYPYPFLDPANGGYGKVAVTIVVVLAAGAAVSIFYAWLGGRLAARRAGISVR